MLPSVPIDGSLLLSSCRMFFICLNLYLHRDIMMQVYSTANNLGMA